MFIEIDTNTYHLKPTALIIDPPKAGPTHSTESDNVGYEIQEAAISLWNNFEIISGKFPRVEI